MNKTLEEARKTRSLEMHREKAEKLLAEAYDYFVEHPEELAVSFPFPRKPPEGLWTALKAVNEEKNYDFGFDTVGIFVPKLKIYVDWRICCNW